MRSPLGIIALFIVLVYAMAGLVSIFAELPTGPLWVLIGFLALFPCLVLMVFFRMVTRHPDLIYGPSDFRDEQNFLRLRGRRESEAGGTLDAADRLYQFWMPDGDSIDEANNEALFTWMRAHGLSGVSLSQFLISAGYESEREAAARDLCGER